MNRIPMPDIDDDTIPFTQAGRDRLLADIGKMLAKRIANEIITDNRGNKLTELANLHAELLKAVGDLRGVGSEDNLLLLVEDMRNKEGTVTLNLMELVILTSTTVQISDDLIQQGVKTMLAPDDADMHTLLKIFEGLILADAADKFTEETISVSKAALAEIMDKIESGGGNGG